MKNHFNFTDPKLNDNHHIDCENLTPEQLEHVLKIYAARGFHETNERNGCRYLCFMPTYGTIGWYARGGSPEIDYPTLARAAVQLDDNTYAVFRINKRHELTEYAQAIGVWSNADMPSMLFQGMGTLVYRDSTDSQIKQISPEEFEHKLKGIYPVVRENRTTENIGEAVKPKYLKQPKLGLIVEFIKDQGDGVFFTGKVVDSGKSEHCPVGYIGNGFVVGAFEPCDYTPPTFEFVDSPAVEQPKTLAEQLAEALKWKDAYKSHLDEGGEIILELVAKVEKLESELATLRGDKEVAYDADWLKLMVARYKWIYIVNEPPLVSVYTTDSNYTTLDPKTSAFIIISALAKELNPQFDADPNQSMFCIQRVHEEVVTGMTYSHMVDAAHSFTSEQSAQKAIDILTQNFPEVLKSYFQL